MEEIQIQLLKASISHFLGEHGQISNLSAKFTNKRFI